MAGGSALYVLTDYNEKVEGRRVMDGWCALCVSMDGNEEDEEEEE